VLGDIVLRCTWVITLMPITLLGKVGVTVGCWMVGREGLFQGLCFSWFCEGLYMGKMVKDGEM